MPVLAVAEAIEKLTHQVEEMDADAILETYNEVFPDDPATEEEAYDDVHRLIELVVEHIHGGLEPEEVVDLWNVVFPRDRQVYFDEEDRQLHFVEGETAA
ncbi:MAG: hypothetical protein DWQ31_07900 [Planctomycetota bacterium]|nr:MAG: hypothetical protein DWQ31_07900 [Planctomycetota bacterium]REJ96115.1 MAG: hypothetical protein DWQ35_05250 [Planctomycetota bacterium]REK21887.1 MAG: hypothetical protein DWQ42_18580 [Planctomycetota bacterium]REK46695.1 MAG: hypothetical protein DWQ46_06265 [Planctomycetota bacterium]